jgi:hypothetical protein
VAFHHKWEEDVLYKTTRSLDLVETDPLQNGCFRPAKRLTMMHEGLQTLDQIRGATFASLGIIAWHAVYK